MPKYGRRCAPRVSPLPKAYDPVLALWTLRLISLGGGNDLILIDLGTDTVIDIGQGTDTVQVSQSATLNGTVTASWRRATARRRWLSKRPTTAASTCC